MIVPENQTDRWCCILSRQRNRAHTPWDRGSRKSLQFRSCSVFPQTATPCNSSWRSSQVHSAPRHQQADARLQRRAEQPGKMLKACTSTKEAIQPPHSCSHIHDDWKKLNFSPTKICLCVQVSPALFKDTERAHHIWAWEMCSLIFNEL